ncbi:hypothetical protein BDW59DRAFT_144065 [Aspergillus cavernicola]|uniref:Uncharacterized protein n=1 Tax=Aspergillus cavernicola TaxID=176166 RepID=A0ABR4IJ68_9EURO
MPSQNLHPKQRYPLRVPDLSMDHLQLLIDILTTEYPLKASACDEKRAQTPSNCQTQQAIKTLPHELRKRLTLPFLSRAFISTTTPCAAHKGLNPCIITHIFRLIKREVEDHLDLIVRHSPEPLKPHHEQAVQCLQSLEGMWWVPNPSRHRNVPKDGMHYQHNRCEACMISRVVKNPKYLQNLRATLKSRTRTGCQRQAPRLLCVIDAALMNYKEGVDYYDSTTASELELGLKNARKDAFRSLHSHSRKCDRKCMDDKSVFRRQTEHRDGGNDNDDSRSKFNHRFEASSQSVPLYIADGIIRPGSSTANSQEQGEAATHTTESQLVGEILATYATLPEEDAAALSLHFPSLLPLLHRQSTYRAEPGRRDYDSATSSSGPSIYPDNINWSPIVKDPGPFNKLIDQIQSLLDERNRLSDASIDSEKLYQALLDDCSRPPNRDLHGMYDGFAETDPSLSSLDQAKSYRSLLGGYSESNYSDSEGMGTYSDDEDEAVPRPGRPGPGGTTWDLFLDDAN